MEVDVKLLAARTAREATRLFIRDHGYSWNERKGSSTVISTLPMTEIHDYCRDAAYDVLERRGLDPDEYLLDLTDLALNELDA